MMTYAITCRACRRHLTAYIHRELTPRRRAFVSAHLNTCTACYSEYARLRQTISELEQHIPLIGARDLDAPRLDAMWRVIRADLRAHPRPKPIYLTPARYSLAALLLVLILAMPFSMRGQALALPTQPRPVWQPDTGTPVASVLVTRIAHTTASPTPSAPRLTPDVESNIAPTGSASLIITDMP